MTPWLFRLLALIVIGTLLGNAFLAGVKGEDSWTTVTYGIGTLLDILLIADLMERGE